MRATSRRVAEVHLLVAIRGDDHHILEMRAADVGAIRQHDPRLEADHHIFADLDVDVPVHERLAVQAETKLMPGIAAVEIATPAGVADDLARTLVDRRGR